MTHETHEWLPVRCCCKPVSLFGFVRVTRGPDINYVDIHRDGVTHRANVRFFQEMRKRETTSAAADYAKVNQATYNNNVIKERAIVSDDLPIEWWRAVDGFVETGMNEATEVIAFFRRHYPQLYEVALYDVRRNQEEKEKQP